MEVDIELIGDLLEDGHRIRNNLPFLSGLLYNGLEAAQPRSFQGRAEKPQLLTGLNAVMRVSKVAEVLKVFQVVINVKVIVTELGESHLGFHREDTLDLRLLLSGGGHENLEFKLPLLLCGLLLPVTLGPISPLELVAVHLGLHLALSDGYELCTVRTILAVAPDHFSVPEGSLRSLSLELGVVLPILLLSGPPHFLDHQGQVRSGLRSCHTASVIIL